MKTKMSISSAQPCFAAVIQPLLYRKKSLSCFRSIDLRPCMTLGCFSRRDFLICLPIVVTFSSNVPRSKIAIATEAKGEGEGVTAQGESERQKEQPKADIDISSKEPEITDRAYLDISINKQPSRRLTLGLYGTIAPKTVANFLALCENGYANTKVYRIVPGLTVQLGDVLNNNGKSGRAATDSGWLEAETFRITHSVPGIVSMVTHDGRVDSRFFVATRKGDSKYLDGKYVAFGRVVEGIEFLDQIEREGEGLVRKPVQVVASGIMR